MPLIINRQLQNVDPWTRLQSVEGESLIWPETKALISGTDWPTWAARCPAKLELGVSITADTTLEDLTPWLDRLSLIEICFEVFRDGRGFSLARLLRRAGYQGELRAAGDVGQDRLAYLERCGFNAFVLPEGRDPLQALAAFEQIQVHYQGAADDPRPIYRQEA